MVGLAVPFSDRGLSRSACDGSAYSPGLNADTSTTLYADVGDLPREHIPALRALKKIKMDPNQVIRLLPSDSKSDIRNHVWDHLVKSGTAQFPLPPHGRIPNFKGSTEACNNAARLDVFRKARSIKIDPDKPLEQIRFQALQAGKTLLVPTPRLRSGLFNRIQVPSSDNSSLRRYATMQGIKDHGIPVDLNEKLTVDLVVVGCVAVSPNGWRIGKGEGYSDMEFAMMVSVYDVSQDVPVIAVVHDCQVMDLPSHLFGPHDLPVDFIATPTRVIECEDRPRRPHGLLWSLLTTQKLSEIPVLKQIRGKEQKMGKDVGLSDSTGVSSRASAPSCGSQFHRDSKDMVESEAYGRTRQAAIRASDNSYETPNVGSSAFVDLHDHTGARDAAAFHTKAAQCIKPESSTKGHDNSVKSGNKVNSVLQDSSVTNDSGLSDSKRRVIHNRTIDDLPVSHPAKTIYIGNLPKFLSVRELKDTVRRFTDKPFTVKWLGPVGYAFLNFESAAVASETHGALQGVSIQGHAIRVEIAKSTTKHTKM